MNLKSITITFILIALFAVCMFTFMISFISQNNPTYMSNMETSEGNASYTAFNELYTSMNNSLGAAESQVGSVKAAANTTKTGYETESSDPTITSFGFYLRSILSAGSVFMSITVNIFNYIYLGFGRILGINTIVTGTIMSLLIITLVLAIWRALRAGE